MNNHCQNLWAQFAKADKAQKDSAEVFDLLNQEGDAHLANLSQNIALLEGEAGRMQEVWDASFETLPDGRKLFGPQFDILEKIFSDSDLDLWKKKSVGISEDNMLKSITLPNDLRDLSFLRYLTTLRELTVENKCPADVSPLSYLTNLKRLSIQEMPIDALSFLAGMEELHYLDLRKTRVSDLSPLSNMLELDCLYISGTPVRDLAPLRGLSKLLSLNISNTNVRDITAISGLTNLSTLNLDHSKVSDLSSIRGLLNLESLGVEGLKLKDISGLQFLTKLTSFRMKGTRTPRIQEWAIDALRERGVQVSV